MDSTVKTVTVELPASIYAELEAMASEQHSNPAQMISAWVHSARQRQMWQQGWAELCDQVQSHPPQHLVTMRDSDGNVDIKAIIEQMRRTRQELFDTEYAHLYR